MIDITPSTASTAAFPLSANSYPRNWHCFSRAWAQAIPSRVFLEWIAFPNRLVSPLILTSLCCIDTIWLWITTLCFRTMSFTLAHFVVFAASGAIAVNFDPRAVSNASAATARIQTSHSNCQHSKYRRSWSNSKTHSKRLKSTSLLIRCSDYQFLIYDPSTDLSALLRVVTLTAAVSATVTFPMILPYPSGPLAIQPLNYFPRCPSLCLIRWLPSRAVWSRFHFPVPFTTSDSSFSPILRTSLLPLAFSSFLFLVHCFLGALWSLLPPLSGVWLRPFGGTCSTLRDPPHVDSRIVRHLLSTSASIGGLQLETWDSSDSRGTPILANQQSTRMEKDQLVSLQTTYQRKTRVSKGDCGESAGFQFAADFQLPNLSPDKWCKGCMHRVILQVCWHMLLNNGWHDKQCTQRESFDRTANQLYNERVMGSCFSHKWWWRNRSRTFDGASTPPSFNICAEEILHICWGSNSTPHH